MRAPSLLPHSANDFRGARSVWDQVEQERVRQRAPALAADLADHGWTMREWLAIPTISACLRHNPVFLSQE